MSEIDQCSQLLDKSISEKQTCVEAKASLDAQIAALNIALAAEKKTNAAQEALNKLIAVPPKKCLGISLGGICVGFKY